MGSLKNRSFFVGYTHFRKIRNQKKVNMRLNQRQIDIAFAAAGIVIIIGYIFLFQRPVNRKLKDLRSEISGFSENGSSRENVESRLNQLNQAKAKLDQEIRMLEKDGFFKADRLWDLMQSLTNIAEEAGLTVLLVHPQMKPGNGSYQQCSLLIKLSGDFLSFYRFLAELERSTPSLKADSLKIEAQVETKPEAQTEIGNEAQAARENETRTESILLPGEKGGRCPVNVEVRFDLITMPP